VKQKYSYAPLEAGVTGDHQIRGPVAEFFFPFFFFFDPQDVGEKTFLYTSLLTILGINSSFSSFA